MVIRERRCVKCQTWTGVRPDATFVDYTLHPFVLRSGGGAVEHMAVFCARGFDALGNVAARDAAAVSIPRSIEVEVEVARA